MVSLIRYISLGRFTLMSKGSKNRGHLKEKMDAFQVMCREEGLRAELGGPVNKAGGDGHLARAWPSSPPPLGKAAPVPELADGAA